MSIISKIIFLSCVILSSSQLHSAVTFQKSGDNLDVVITESFSIALTLDTRVSNLGISFQNVYSTPQADHFPGHLGSAALTLNLISSQQGAGGGVFSSFGSQNLYLLFNAGAEPFDGVVGDTIEISAGTRALPGFFSNPSAPSTVPDQADGPITVFLISNATPRGQTLVNVPEPSVSALLLGAIILLRRRR